MPLSMKMFFGDSSQSACQLACRLATWMDEKVEQINFSLNDCCPAGYRNTNSWDIGQCAIVCMKLWNQLLAMLAACSSCLTLWSVLNTIVNEYFCTLHILNGPHQCLSANNRIEMAFFSFFPKQAERHHVNLWICNVMITCYSHVFTGLFTFGIL